MCDWWYYDSTTEWKYVPVQPPKTPAPETEPQPAPVRPVAYGWQCPRCGSVYAPFVYKCEYCVPRLTASSTITIGA